MRWTRLLLLGALLAACSDRAPHGLWTDPTLTASTLAEGVVIGGVVDLTATRDLFEQQRDAEVLEAVLLSERPSLPRAGWAAARSTLDPDTLDAILESYRRTGRLSAPQLGALQPLLGQGRYLALARIDLDRTLWEYMRQSRETTDRSVVDLEPESRRTIALLLDLYDLRTGRLAFTIPVERTGVEHGVTYTVEGIDAVPTEGEIRSAIEELDRSSDRPAPVDRAALISSTLREAVKHLP